MVSSSMPTPVSIRHELNEESFILLYAICFYV